MMILFIGTLPPPVGGVAIWMSEIIKECGNSNIEYRIVDNGLKGKRAQSSGGNKKNIFSEIHRFLSINKNLRKEIKQCHPTVIHFNITCSPLGTVRDYFLIKGIKKHKIPVVLHCHCNVEYEIGKARFGLFFLKKLFNISSKIIVLNQNSKDYVFSLGYESVVVPNFIREEMVIDKKEIRNNLQTVIYAGHIRKTKGVIELIEAAKILPNIDFILAGTNIGDINIDDMIKNINNVSYIGQMDRTELFSKYKDVDAFIFPSYSEGFSISLLEAMAQGLPIVASNVGANYEMVENKGGVVFNEITPEVIFDAITKIFDQNIRKQMSSWNIEKVKEHYTNKVVFNQLIQIYEGLNE